MRITDIETDKIYLKLIDENDFNDMKEYLNDEYTMRFFDHGVMDDESIREFMSRKNRVFLIALKDSGKVIGHFIYNKWFMVNTYEIGWVLNKQYHNLGIITKIAKKVIQYAFEYDNAHRIVATCQPENIASKRICEKAGMRLEGFFQKCIYVERLDEWWDELFFAILEKEYRESRG